MQKVYDDATISAPIEVEADDLAREVNKALAEPHVVEVRIRHDPLFEDEMRPHGVVKDGRGRIRGQIWRAMLRPFVKKAHSHKRENERRARQIAKGVLKASKE